MTEKLLTGTLSLNTNKQIYSKEKRDLGVEKKYIYTKTKQTGEKQVSLFKFNLPIENVMSADCLNLSVSAEAPPTSRVYFTASLA